MAKKRFRIRDKQGNVINYDVGADSITLDGENGKDLPTKLAEMETQIGEAGQGDGTVKGVKMNNGSPIEPDGDGVVDLGTVITQHQDISGKVDKNGTDSLMSAAEHTKLAGIEAGAEKNIIKGIKANGASTNLPVDQNGVVELPPAGSTISPATASPSMDGTANVGSSDKYAREDHVHPHDTSKANDNAVVKSISVNGTAQTKDSSGNVNISGLATTGQLAQKQDTLTEGTGISIAQNGTISVDADSTPTPNSPKPVTSGGVSTALQTLLSNIRIGANGNWYVGDITDPNNDTGVKAQGPTGNCTITDASQMVSEIVNNLDDGGTAKFLSAEMGKKLKNAIVAIYNALSPYAFAFGKPIIDLNAVIPVTVTVGTHVTYTGPDMASVGNSIDIQLGTDDNLFVIDDDEVTVTMGGNDVTDDYYIKAQSKISIPSVTAEVVITVGNAITYIDTNLAFQLDCKNGVTMENGAPTKWKDIKGNKEFTLSNTSIASDGSLEFNGTTSKGVASGDLDVYFRKQSVGSATVEAVIDMALLTPAADGRYPILSNTLAGRVAASFRATSNTTCVAVATVNSNEITLLDGAQNSAFFFNKSNKAFGASQAVVVVDGEEPTYPWTVPGQGGLDVNDYNAGLSSVLAVGYGNINGTEYFFTGKIMAIRVYNAQLSASQIKYNYNIDKKRFNLA